MSRAGAKKSRVVGAGVAGAVLVLLVLAIEFWWPQLKPQVGVDQLEVVMVGVQVVTWASLAGGTWLLGYAWHASRSEPDGETVSQEA